MADNPNLSPQIIDLFSQQILITSLIGMIAGASGDPTKARAFVETLKRQSNESASKFDLQGLSQDQSAEVKKALSDRLDAMLSNFRFE